MVCAVFPLTNFRQLLRFNNAARAHGLEPLVCRCTRHGEALLLRSVRAVPSLPALQSPAEKPEPSPGLPSIRRG